MTNINLTLPNDMASFVEEGVASGRYRDADDVIHSGLRLLERLDRDESVRIAELKRAVDIGLAAADQKQTVTVLLDDMPAFLAGLGETGRPGV